MTSTVIVGEDIPYRETKESLARECHVIRLWFRKKKESFKVSCVKQPDFIPALLTFEFQDDRPAKQTIGLNQI